MAGIRPAENPHGGEESGGEIGAVTMGGGDGGLELWRWRERRTTGRSAMRARVLNLATGNELVH